ncbi:unnamed protein product [Larinioides sclopetarius]|uniref:Uncharacterized protein n=1 Tax=Larinioides sclopetarius TaxID=280406 RepID=A0AAV2BC27_9ARAC
MILLSIGQPAKNLAELSSGGSHLRSWVEITIRNSGLPRILSTTRIQEPPSEGSSDWASMRNRKTVVDNNVWAEEPCWLHLENTTVPSTVDFVASYKNIFCLI